MTFWPFLGEAFRRAFVESWNRAGTWATYISAVLLFAGLKFGLSGETVNWLLVFVPLILLVGLVGAGLLRAAHGLYLKEHSAQKELRTEVDSLKQRVVILSEQIADPNRQERLQRLRDFIEKGKAFLDRLKQSTDSHAYASAAHNVRPWNQAVEEFLDSQFPAELTQYLESRPDLDTNKTHSIRCFLESTVEALEAILNKAQGSS